DFVWKSHAVAILKTAIDEHTRTRGTHRIHQETAAGGSRADVYEIYTSLLKRFRHGLHGECTTAGNLRQLHQVLIVGGVERFGRDAFDIHRVRDDAVDGGNRSRGDAG